jgi:hypothetical protein
VLPVIVNPLVKNLKKNLKFLGRKIKMLFTYTKNRQMAKHVKTGSEQIDLPCYFAKGYQLRPISFLLVEDK